MNIAVYIIVLTIIPLGLIVRLRVFNHLSWRTIVFLIAASEVAWAVFFFIILKKE